ncbi:MAG TPA: EscU/YscU/HrcU family type III secretion system export apparatus switch protein [Gammaproteobacteria bacterium]|nr:EscU/YscU/HrcU family type III secretion system export apparatus switch protein [Gammaproteobacteria bacterium]
MADQQPEQDRTEPATPTKLRDARRRGQVAKSLEINSLFILSVVLGIFYLLGERMITEQLDMSRALFSQAHQVNMQPVELVQWFEAMVERLIAIYWPLMAGVMLVAVVMNMAQTGPVFSFFPLKPDMQRINPVAGFKRLFSTRLLFESIKTVVKIFLFAGVIYFAIAGLLPSLISLMDRGSAGYAPFLLDNTNLMAFKLLGVLLFVALLDLLYTRWDFSKKMRMSRREIKEEVKRREGDPLIRAKIKELQREAAKRAGSIQRVPDADVLITNPTHLAVALVYQRGVMIAPRLVAKGSGELARKMREVARRHAVPVIEDAPLARTLFRSTELDHTIAENLYPAVAKILVRAFAMRQGRHASTPGPRN